MTREAAEDILELPRRYSAVDVRKAYTTLARRWHPDAAMREGRDVTEAQERMVAANQARQKLTALFEDDPERIVSRSRGGIEGGFAGVDWRSASAGADPWAFVDEWDVPVQTDAPVTVRSLLLGPYPLRILFLVLFCWLWWNAFSLLPYNLDLLMPEGVRSATDVSVVVAHAVYPTYLVLYEALTGNVSLLVREIINGFLSWVLGSYVPLAGHRPADGCALARLIRDQAWAILLAPVVVFLVAAALDAYVWYLKISCGVLATILGADLLAAMANGGYVNVWAHALSEQVERLYLRIHARLLRRCGQWDV